MLIDMTLAINIAISLFAGKAIGVFVFSYLSIKLKIAILPKQTDFIHIIGVAILMSLGFTGSLFIGNPAYPENEIFMNTAKAGFIAVSIFSGITGYLLLKRIIKPK